MSENQAMTFDLESIKSAAAKIGEEVPNLVAHLNAGKPVDGRFGEAIDAFETLMEKLQPLGEHPRMAEHIHSRHTDEEDKGPGKSAEPPPASD